MKPLTATLPAHAPAAVAARRIRSIDILRGLVMVIMALDHVRDFFYYNPFNADPLDAHVTTPALYFTRWITHFCAPVFVCLSGTSAYLMGLKKTKAELSMFLLKRGLWLIVVEVVLITLAWTFNPFYNVIILQVIWAIGISMIILAMVVQLPFYIVLAIGLLIVGGHDLLDYPEQAHPDSVGVVWNVAHHAAFTPYQYAPHHVALVVYAFLPWTGIMILGYCLGRWFEPGVEARVRKRRLLLLGAGLTALFVIIRCLNAYGNPSPWVEQMTARRTLFSFLNVNKYPPSLMYTCITLGPAMILLALLERAENGLTRVLNVFGRVPFFYYVLHLYLIHLLDMIGFFASGYSAKDISSGTAVPFFFRPDGFGYSLWIVYAVWILVIVLLYPLCRWYNRYKSTHRYWWLSYL